MNQRDIIRAWKDPEARETMAAQGLDMPEHPAGIVELPDYLLGETNGAGPDWWPPLITQVPFCGLPNPVPPGGGN